MMAKMQTFTETLSSKKRPYKWLNATNKTKQEQQEISE